MIQTWQLSEIKKGPETVRKTKIIKIIKHNHTCEICNNFGDTKFREHLVHENGNKLFTDEEFSMKKPWPLSEIRKGLETVENKSMRKNENIKHNNTCEISNNYGDVNFREHLVHESR